MRKSIMFFVMLIFFFTLSSNAANYVLIGTPKKIAEIKPELKLQHSVQFFLPLCYEQQAFTDCGVFNYRICFSQEPTMEQFLAAIEAYDYFLNAICTEP